MTPDDPLGGLFGSLDDPTPPQPGPERLTGVMTRGRRLRRRRQAGYAAGTLSAVAIVIGTAVGLTASTSATNNDVIIPTTPNPSVQHSAGHAGRGHAGGIQQLLPGNTIPRGGGHHHSGNGIGVPRPPEPSCLPTPAAGGTPAGGLPSPGPSVTATSPAEGPCASPTATATPTSSGSPADTGSPSPTVSQSP